jgi:lipid A 3-O-deacylase
MGTMSFTTLAGMPMRSLFLALLLSGAGAGAFAAEAARSAFVAGGGVTVHGTLNLTAGATWRWMDLTPRGDWSLWTEVFASHWSAKQAVGPRASFTQIGVVPVFRYRFDGGRSPWFAEIGIGLSWMDRLYTTERKQFSTRFNFHDNIGFGRNFGANGEHELSVRLSHVSNGGIKEPNPGENFIQLRYAHSF